MNTWTIPRRISLGFLLLVLLSLLIGAIAFWRIVGVNRQVTLLATNTVPSVIELGRITQLNARSGRAARRALQLVDEPQLQSAAEANFREAKKAGDASVTRYSTSLKSDDEDIRLFNLAVEARTLFYKNAEALIDLVKANKPEEAEDLLLKVVDPSLEDCVDKFKTSIDYNADLASKAATAADAIVSWSYWVIGTTLALAALAGLAVGWLISRAVSRSLGMISDALEDGATQTASASGQVSAASHLLAEGCNEQGSSVAETSAALEEMSVMIRSTADNAVKAKAFANQARVAAQSGAETMVEMNTAMHAIEASSAEVAKIVKNIDEIAFQTNILALNAAVEAARAGEAGAGFAVVADEVRSLAQRSAAAAKETAEKIDAAIANSQRGSLSCGKVGESLHEIVQKVAAADALVAEISTAAREQSQGIQQVGTAMAQLDKVTQGNATNAQQSASAAEELNSQARTLQDLVGYLRSLVTGAESTGIATRPRTAARRAEVIPTKVARQAIRSGAPLRGLTEGPRGGRMQIPMPGDAGAVGDQEDRNFTKF
jgi:methyl-accepting chemotaxis protein